MGKVIVIVGPTGIGKSKLSIQLAKKYNGEIISGDAYQVYKELTIGTAKILKEEQEGIVHHLVDCYSINDEYNVKKFQEEGRKIISEIQERGKTPIICGGTGLYIKALLYDYEFNDEEKDNEYLSYLKKLNNEKLYKKLKEIDLESSLKIHHNNRQRIIRALEIAHTGELKSEKINKQKHELIYDAIFIGLTMDRNHLYERINLRVDKMFEQGLLKEVDNVIKNIADFDKQALKAIGYKEFKEYFLGNQTLEDVKENIKLNTRRFAKRQYTWFKNQMNIKWFDKENENFEENVIDYIDKNIETE